MLYTLPGNLFALANFCTALLLISQLNSTSGDIIDSWIVDSFSMNFVLTYQITNEISVLLMRLIISIQFHCKKQQLVVVNSFLSFTASSDKMEQPL